MTDMANRSGWWQASDGNWYPPQGWLQGPDGEWYPPEGWVTAPDGTRYPPGWWQASDGRFYPPAQQPAAPTPAPRPAPTVARPRQPVGAPATPSIDDRARTADDVAVAGGPVAVELHAIVTLERQRSDARPLAGRVGAHRGIYGAASAPAAEAVSDPVAELTRSVETLDHLHGTVQRLEGEHAAAVAAVARAEANDAAKQKRLIVAAVLAAVILVAVLLVLVVL